MKKLIKAVRIITALIFLLSGITYSQTTLTHGYSVFLDKGLMIDALTYPEYNVSETLNVANWAASNFTSANTWTVNRAYTNGSYWGYWLTDNLSNLRDISAGGGYRLGRMNNKNAKSSFN